MVVKPSRDNFVGDLSDEVALFIVQKFQLDIGHGCGLFQDAEGLDKLSRHRVPPRPGLEILQRTLSLSPPITVRRDGNFTHGIFFDASVSHCHAPFFCRSFRSGSKFKVQSSTSDPELKLESFVNPFIPAA